MFTIESATTQLYTAIEKKTKCAMTTKLRECKKIAECWKKKFVIAFLREILLFNGEQIAE